MNYSHKQGQIMDWQQITLAVSRAQTLDATARDDYLSGLQTQSPETYETVQSLLLQKSNLDAFMMTAVGDYLPPEDPIYKTDDIVGLWKIESLIGSGGMGDVYKAQRADSLYDQTVALKVMKGTDKKRKARFDAERQRLAVLSHPGIAMIVDGGQSKEGHPYLAMQFVDGQPIKTYCEAQGAKRNQILGLFLKACEAVTSAHNNLILHRDIKSDNILVTDKGQVKLVDFGIATLLGEEDADDVAPFSLGNAAPEQLNGDTVSVQTDLFALGVLLHHLLTGRLPTRQPDGSVQAKLDGLSSELCAIIEKCLQAEPKSRYESVSALSQDIRAVLNHQAVTAFEGGPIYRVKKLMRRAPLASALSSGLAASLLIGIGVSQHFARTAQAEAERANAELITSNWLRQKSNLDVSMSDAYQDAFQYAFGQFDPGKLSELFIEYHASVVENYKESDPEYTALVSHTIGEHFIRRNDYRNGRRILEPWVTQEYGGEGQLLSFGQAMLAHAYNNMNEPERAAELFLKSASFYPGTPDEYSFDHVAPATLAGILSSDEKTQDNAELLIRQMLDKTDSDFNRAFFLARLSSLEIKRGNLDSAHSALTQSINTIRKGRAGDFSSEHILRLRLTSLEIFYKRNFVEALNQINLVQTYMQSLRGENISTGEVSLYKSVISWHEKDLDIALEESKKAELLISKYTNSYKNNGLLYSQMGMIYADLNDFISAQETLEKLRLYSNEVTSSWYLLLEVYISLRRDGIEAAKILYQKNIETMENTLTLPEQRFYIDFIKSEGVGS